MSLAIALAPAYLGYRAYRHFRSKERREAEFRIRCGEIDLRRRQIWIRRSGLNRANRMDTWHGCLYSQLG